MSVPFFLSLVVLLLILTTGGSRSVQAISQNCSIDCTALNSSNINNDNKSLMSMYYSDCNFDISVCGFNNYNNSTASSVVESLILENVTFVASSFLLNPIVAASSIDFRNVTIDTCPPSSSSSSSPVPLEIRVPNESTTIDTATNSSSSSSSSLLSLFFSFDSVIVNCPTAIKIRANPELIQSNISREVDLKVVFTNRTVFSTPLQNSFEIDFSTSFFSARQNSSNNSISISGNSRLHNFTIFSIHQSGHQYVLNSSLSTMLFNLDLSENSLLETSKLKFLSSFNDDEEDYQQQQETAATNGGHGGGFSLSVSGNSQLGPSIVGGDDDFEIQLINVSHMIYNFSEDSSSPTLTTLPCGSVTCNISFSSSSSSGGFNGENSSPFPLLQTFQLAPVSHHQNDSSTQMNVFFSSDQTATTNSLLLQGRNFRIVEASKMSTTSSRMLDSLSITASSKSMTLMNSSSFSIETPIINTFFFDLGENTTIITSFSDNSPLVFNFTVDKSDPRQAAHLCDNKSNGSTTRTRTMTTILRDYSSFFTYNGTPIITDRTSNNCDDPDVFAMSFDLSIFNSVKIEANRSAATTSNSPPPQAYLFRRNFATTNMAVQRNKNQVHAVIKDSCSVVGNLTQAISFGRYVESASSFSGQLEEGEMSLTISCGTNILLLQQHHDHSQMQQTETSFSSSSSLLETIPHHNSNSFLEISSDSILIFTSYDCFTDVQCSFSLTTGAAPTFVNITSNAIVNITLAQTVEVFSDNSHDARYYLVDSRLPNQQNSIDISISDGAQVHIFDNSSENKRIVLLNLDDSSLSIERVQVSVFESAQVNFFSDSASLGFLARTSTGSLLPPTSSRSPWNVNGNVFYSLLADSSSDITLESTNSSVDLFSIFDNNAIINLTMTKNCTTRLSAGGFTASHFFQFGEVAATAVNYGVDIFVSNQCTIELYSLLHQNGTTHLLDVTGSQNPNPINITFGNGVSIRQKSGLATTSYSLSQVVSGDKTTITFGPDLVFSSQAGLDSGGGGGGVNRAFDFIAVQSTAASSFSIFLNNVRGTNTAAVAGGIRVFGQNVFTKIFNRSSLTINSTQYFSNANTPTALFLTVAENTTFEVVDNNNNDENSTTTGFIVIHPRSVSFASYYAGSRNVHVQIINSPIFLDCTLPNNNNNNNNSIVADGCTSHAIGLFDSILSKGSSIQISGNGTNITSTSSTGGFNGFRSFAVIMVQRFNGAIDTCDGSTTLGDARFTIENNVSIFVSYDGTSSLLVPPDRSSVAIFRFDDLGSSAGLCILSEVNSAVSFTHQLPSLSLAASSSPPPPPALTALILPFNSFIERVSINNSYFNLILPSPANTSTGRIDFAPLSSSMSLYSPKNSVVHNIDYFENIFYCGREGFTKCWFMNVSAGGMYPDNSNFVRNRFYFSTPSSSSISSLESFSQPLAVPPSGKKAFFDCNTINDVYFDPFDSVPSGVVIQLPVTAIPCPSTSSTTTTTTITSTTTATTSTTTTTSMTTSTTPNGTGAVPLPSSSFTTLSSSPTSSPNIFVTTTTTEVPEALENAEKVAEGSTAAVATTAGVSSLFSFTSTGPNVASRVGILQRLVSCKPTLNEPLPFYLSPISLELNLAKDNETAANDVRYHVGGLVSNLGIIAGMLFLSFLLAFMHHYCCFIACSTRAQLEEEEDYEHNNNNNNNNNKSKGEQQRRGVLGLHFKSLGVARIPGTTLYPTLFFTQAIIGSALVCFLHGGLRPAVLGVAALAVVLSMIVFFLMIVGRSHQFYSTFRSLEEIKRDTEKRKKDIISYFGKKNKNNTTTDEKESSLDDAIKKILDEYSSSTSQKNNNNNQRDVHEVTCWEKWIEGLNGKWFDVSAEFEHLSFDERSRLPLQCIDKTFYEQYFLNPPFDEVPAYCQSGEQEQEAEQQYLPPKSFASSHFGRRYGALFDSYKGPTRWFVIIEISLCVLLGVVDGLADKMGCDNAIHILTIMFGVYLLSLILLRPYATRFHMFFGFFITLCQFVSVVIAVVPAEEFLTPETGDAISISVATGSLFLALVQAAILLLQDGARFVLDTLKRHQEDDHHHHQHPLIQKKAYHHGSMIKNRNNNNNNNGGDGSQNHSDVPLLQVPERHHSNHQLNVAASTRDLIRDLRNEEQRETAQVTPPPPSSPPPLSAPPALQGFSAIPVVQEGQASDSDNDENEDTFKDHQRTIAKQEPPSSVSVEENANNSNPPIIVVIPEEQQLKGKGNTRPLLNDSILSNSDFADSSSASSSTSPSPMQTRQQQVSHPRNVTSSSNPFDPKVGVRRPSMMSESGCGGGGGGPADSIRLLSSSRSSDTPKDDKKSKKSRQHQPKYDQDDLDVL